MHVLLDSNIYLQDPALSSPKFVALKLYLERTGSQLLVPQMVKDEVKNRLHGRGYEAARSIRGSIVYQLGLIKDKDVTKEKLAETLTARFEQLISEYPSITLGYEGVELDKLINKSLKGLAPFKKSSKEFKDAVIWEILKHYLLENTVDKVAFVSLNGNDFGVKQLDDTLSQELEEIGAVSRLYYYKDLNTLLTLHANPIKFIDDAFISKAVELEIISYSRKVNPNILDTRLKHDVPNFMISNAEYEGHSVEGHYILDEEEDNVTVYAFIDIFFRVDIEMLMDENYEFSMPTTVLAENLFDEERGWMSVGMKLIIEKNTQKVIQQLIDETWTYF